MIRKIYKTPSEIEEMNAQDKLVLLPAKTRRNFQWLEVLKGQGIQHYLSLFLAIQTTVTYKDCFFLK